MSTLPVGDEPSLEDFYDHAPCGYLSLRADGTITRANATFREWTGHPESELLDGRRFASLLTIGGQIFYESHCMPLLLAGQPITQVALDVRRADGSAMPVLFGATVHATGGDEGPPFVRVTLLDVSQRRQFEQELVARNDALERSNEEYDAFAHAAAHDLRAPLRGIGMTLEFAIEDGEEQLPGTVEQELRTALRLVGRMRHMLDDLLAYAQGGMGAWAPQPIGLQDATAEVVDMLGPRAEGARISAASEQLTTDPVALRQVLLNLVGNALKYSGSGAAVVEIGACTLEEAAHATPVPAFLRAAAADTQVVTVTDHGIGIDTADHDRIFSLFSQLDPDAEGSGTGLALCRLVCRRHGGEIWLRSALGEGSTFFVVPGR